MKVLMLGWELPPHNSGGLGVACLNMSKELAKQGADIDFVLPYHADHPGVDFMNIHSATDLSPLDKFGIGAYDVYSYDEEKPEKIITPSLNTVRDVQKNYIKYVEELVIPMRPDVIHVHDWLTMEAGMRAKALTGAPLIVHVHATEFDRSGNNIGNPVVHEIERQGLVMADRIVAVSDITKNIIINEYNIPANKIEVVHNAIDISVFNTGYEYDVNTYKYLEGLKKEGYTIISVVTRFTIQKGLINFIRAAAKAVQKYDKLAFLMAGDGEQRDELVRLAADLGIADKMFFTGFIRGKKWRDAYMVSDVFVLSSVSEPFGLTALEAAFHDNAIIITKQSGVGEVLNNVFKYDFWDEDRLADQIIGLATSDVLKTALTEGVKKEYAKISWYDVAKTCMNLYQQTKDAKKSKQAVLV